MCLEVNPKPQCSTGDGMVLSAVKPADQLCCDTTACGSTLKIKCLSCLLLRDKKLWPTVAVGLPTNS